jgi:hypothetical protein
VESLDLSFGLDLGLQEHHHQQADQHCSLEIAVNFGLGPNLGQLQHHLDSGLGVVWGGVKVWSDVVLACSDVVLEWNGLGVVWSGVECPKTRLVRVRN